jgi:hypothetical protein
MKLRRPRPLPLHRLREIGVAANVDPRSVERVLLGLPTRGMVRERVELALVEAGLWPPLAGGVRTRPGRAGEP